MLKIMEDEQKIFRAWLYKIVKKDKTITGRKLAKKIGVKEPTLTAYHSGRKDETGEKKFPVIPIDKRNAILSVTKTSDKEMMEASEGIGNAIKKKEESHKMAAANKAFAHFARY